MALANLKQAALPVEPVNIPSSVTGNIDTVVLLQKRSVKWVVSITDATNNLYRCSEILAIHNGTSVSHTEYAIVGDSLPCEASVVVSGGDMVLQLSNNGSETLKVDSVSIPVSI